MSPSRSSSVDAGRGCPLARLREHRRRGVDSEHVPAGLARDRDRDAAVADRELDERAVRLPGELDVEGDVVGHVRRPVVVDRREGVVEAPRNRWLQSPDGRRRRSRTRRSSAIAAAARPGRARGGARPLPRSQERAQAGAARGARPRDRNGAERASASALEAALDAREAELARAELDDGSRGAVDVTLPGERRAARAPAPDHADPPRGGGHLPRARLPGRRRPRGRDDALQLRRAQLPAAATRRARRSQTLFLDDETRCCARRRRPRRSGRWRRSSRRSTSSRSAASTGATRRTRRTRRSSTRSRGSPSTRASRSPTSRGRSTACSRRSSARSAAPSSARTTSRSRSRRSRPYVSCHVCDGAGCPRLPPLRLDRDRRRRDGRPDAVRVRRLRPRALHRLRVRLGARADRRAPPRDPRPARALAQRPATARRSSDDRSRSPGCASTSASTCRANELARRLSVSALEVERVIDARRRRRRRQPRPLPRRQGRRGGQAPERRPAAALPGRRRRGRAAPDRLRRLELRRRRDGRRRRCPARSSRAPTSRSARRSCAASSRAG